MPLLLRSEDDMVNHIILSDLGHLDDPLNDPGYAPVSTDMRNTQDTKVLEIQ